MKLVINYDFFNAILNVNEGINPLKIVRNNKKLYVAYYLPFFTIGNILSTNNIMLIAQELIMEFGFVLGSELFALLITRIDYYKNKSIRDLKQLVLDLNRLFIRTDYDLLILSELCEKNYKININKEEFNILEQKYVLIPTYDYNNNIKKTCILQEHNIGSNKYILSIGSPKKELKLVYSSI